MSDPNTLGRLVRRRRLESGYSLGQLASKVGKTAAEVRAWERDAELPEHGILERLSETLEIDLAEIQARLEEAPSDKIEEPVETPAAEQAQVADSAMKKPKSKKAKASEPKTEEPEQEEPEPDHAESTAAAEAVDDPFTPPAPEAVADGPPEPDFDLLDAPTEPVPVPVITETATAARAERAVAVLEEPAPRPMAEPTPDADPGLLRYLEPIRLLFDPNSRYLYWIRAGLTVVVMLIFAVILFDQFGKLLDAVGELLDTIEPTATTPDDLDALGPIVR
jgi:transcriptional regulator with XRE-family HTH domain